MPAFLCDNNNENDNGDIAAAASMMMMMMKYKNKLCMNEFRSDECMQNQHE